MAQSEFWLGAGSGKTKVLTRKIAYLVEVMKQDPRGILALTFTNKAANEMRERVEAIICLLYTSDAADEVY